MDYMDLCKLCFIECILIDDGLGVADFAEDYKWHDQLTPGENSALDKDVVALAFNDVALYNSITKQEGALLKFLWRQVLLA